MSPRLRFILAKLALAIATGVLLRFVLDLHPIWWLVWIVPALPLLIAIRFRPREARWMVSLAVVLGASVNFHYYRLVMPLPAVILVDRPAILALDLPHLRGAPPHRPLPILVDRPRLSRPLRRGRLPGRSPAS